MRLEGEQAVARRLRTRGETIRLARLAHVTIAPVPAFLPTGAGGMHPFFLADRRGSYALLFEAALETLHDVCRRRLGAMPGTIAVLHTWTQTLAFHPHLHCIVTGGGLATSRDRWITSRPGFLVPVRILSRVFRGKLLDRFHRALQARTSGVGAPLGQRLIRQAASKEWVVYSKPPMAGPAQVLRYLGRYTHRIAIGNERLLALNEGRVTFRYRDRKHGGAKKLLTLEAPAFVQRFLQHVLPRGFVRVRHFGLQANGCRSRLIAQARELLHTPAPAQPDNIQRESWQDLYQRLTGREPACCPYCGNRTLRRVAVPPINQHARGP